MLAHPPGEASVVQVENRILVDEVEGLVGRMIRIGISGVVEPVKMDTPPGPSLQNPLALSDRNG
jgi:hypothetical protein